jgi:hypothetical protein
MAHSCPAYPFCLPATYQRVQAGRSRHSDKRLAFAKPFEWAQCLGVEAERGYLGATSREAGPSIVRHRRHHLRSEEDRIEEPFCYVRTEYLCNLLSSTSDSTIALLGWQRRSHVEGASRTPLGFQGYLKLGFELCSLLSPCH